MRAVVVGLAILAVIVLALANEWICFLVIVLLVAFAIGKFALGL